MNREKIEKDFIEKWTNYFRPVYMKEDESKLIKLIKSGIKKRPKKQK